jgi:glycosyltransferase involved in cell wall biosynthesis
MPEPPPTPLRLAFLVSYFHPFASGAERQALAQARELVRRGHSVHVLTRDVPGYPVEDEEVDGVFIHRRIRTSGAGPLFGLSFVASTIRALRKLRASYDLIHTHQALWEAVATGIGRRLLGGVPTLIQPASSGAYGEAQELSRTRGCRLLRRAIFRNSTLAAISADIEREWRAHGMPAERIVRTSSGVDTEQFHPGPSTMESTLLPRPRVMFTGRFHPQKNLDLLLDAWPEVARRSPANLILVGRGAEQERLRGRADALGIADRVQLTGPVDDPADALRAADLFALPSVAEGMSNSLLEAMATALPCLATAIGGNQDLLGPGPAGMLLPHDNPSAWAQAVVGLLENPQLAQSLGQTAHARVQAEYSVAAVVNRYEQLYRALIGNRQSAVGSRQAAVVRNA